MISIPLAIVLVCVAVVVGVMMGAGAVLWLFARDPTVVRIREDDVVVKQSVLDEVVRRAKGRQDIAGKSRGQEAAEDDDEE